MSNGRYSVLVSPVGAGFSSWRGIALSPWQADRTLDPDGFFFYLRDLDDGRFWSATSRPIAAAAKELHASSSAGRVTFVCKRNGIEARTDVCVADDDAEIRLVTLRNDAAKRRRVEITSYIELALTEAAAFASHPAFRKLFVQTEIDESSGILLAQRRRRAADEPTLWVAHGLSGEGAAQFETDRARFVGRGMDLERPAALSHLEPLSGTLGSVLDPIFSLRGTVTLEPGAEVRFVAILAAAESRDAALSAARNGLAANPVEAIFTRAADIEKDRRRHLRLSDATAEKLSGMAAAILYGDPDLRGDPSLLLHSLPTPDLTRLRLRPNVPLVVVRTEQTNGTRVLRDALRAQEYWRALGLDTQLLVTAKNDQACLDVLGRAGWDRERHWAGTAGLDHTLLTRLNGAMAVACRVLPAAARPRRARHRTGRRFATPVPQSSRRRQPHPVEPLLSHDNGYGGFRADGSEYVIRLPATEHGPRRPPLPWVNVIANERFGFLVSESGAGCTWNGNSRENRLTPWVNDPIVDPHEEALWVRDEERNVYWSPLSGPSPAPGDYEATHGFGYSRWRHAYDQVETETCFFVARHEPVKVMRVRLTNRGTEERRLSVFCYLRLVLGTTPAESGRFVQTWVDRDTGAIFACNRFRGVFSDGICFVHGFAAGGGGTVHVTGDRAAFIGRHGSLARPRAVERAHVLDGVTGGHRDPCAAVQVVVRIPAGEQVDCIFLLGEEDGEEKARALCRAYGTQGRVEAALEEVGTFWRDLLSVVQVRTPEPSIDVMLNGWLLYQVVSCRLWGRSAFYQSGGAFGFRDQLQDSTALVYADPQRTRAQILLHAAHQFEEGDVLHWWHPPDSRGIRTRFSDDLLWLPFVTCFYIDATGDRAILDERVGFVQGDLLEQGQDEVFLRPQRSPMDADLYEHCCLTIDRSLAAGEHGLPLMGTGDWNDGMNRVGREGRGESVWMGFFLYSILGSFAEHCDQRGDQARAQRYRARQDELRVALEAAGWDGEWYRRAYYDDGTPLGSARNDECRIDALAQAWAVLSGAVPRERAEQAMDAVEKHLVNEEAGIVHLLTPPFDRTSHDPGYIKGYVPGIRENGGQYTHAALWVVKALAELGRRNRAAPLLKMLSPVTHGGTEERIATYRVEPYVVAADVYGVDPHLGRGGWTWYTGSAAWMYRVGLESILGFRLVGGSQIRIQPCMPDSWPEISISYRPLKEKTRYDVVILNPDGCAAAVVAAEIDGESVPIRNGAAIIPFRRDGAQHRVKVVLGRM